MPKNVTFVTSVPYFDDIYHYLLQTTTPKQAESAQRLLAEAGKILSNSLDYATRLTDVAQLAVPELADWCVVDIVESDSGPQVAISHVEPEKTELAYELWPRYPPDWNAPIDVLRVLHMGQSELYTHISDELLAAAARDAEHLLLRDVGLESAMMVPLIARGRILGVITFVSAGSGRRYEVTDLSLAEELARRAAMALDNARLDQTEQEIRQAIKWAALRMTALQAVTAALAKALTLTEVSKVIVEQGVAMFEAAAGLIGLVDEQGTSLETLYASGYPDNEVEA